MRSAFAAFLRGFVLPFGATSGRRIVFDGVGGTIQIYRSDGTLALQLGHDTFPSFEDALQVFTGDPDEDLQGAISASITGSGGTRNLSITMLAPTFVGTSDFPFFSIIGRSQDNTTDPPVFRMDHDGPEGRFSCPALIGEATLVAGTIAVARTSIVATSRIYLTRRVVGGAPGFLSYVLNPGVGFTINSTSATDTSIVEWLHLAE